MALEDLRGRPVVIDFWATWCRPCHELLRSLDRLSRRPEFADAVFLAINVDRGDRERAADMIDDLNLHLPVLWGGTEVMSRYWVKVLPSTFLVDRRGLLRGRWAGAGDGALEDLAKELQKTLTDPADSSIQ